MIREETYYSLLTRDERSSADSIADYLGDNFIGSHFEQKWFTEYYFIQNNKAFLERLRDFYRVALLYEFLNEQLGMYVDRCKGNYYSCIEQWLANTVFICRNEYARSGNQVYGESIKWCEDYGTAIKEEKERPRFDDPNYIPEKTDSRPTLYIKPEARDSIHKALIPFVDTEDHSRLFDLLSQKIIDGNVTISHRQGSIAYVFRQALEAGHCHETKTKVRDWLVFWFRVKNKDGISLLTPPTVYDALSKDTLPAKSHRIPYKP